MLPLPCLIEAAHVTGMLEPELLNMLIDHRAVLLVSDDPDDWVALAALRALVDGPDRASAALLALDAAVDVMTRDATWYQGVGDGQIGHEFED
jgi:hypothetical protein